MKKTTLITFLIVLSQLSVFSQATFKETIKNYEDICFCNYELAHPVEILYLDNNLELLFAMKEGKTINQLKKSGFKFTKSQINLLKYSKLIEKKDSLYQSIVPILSEDETQKLREETMVMSKEILPLLQDDYTKLCQLLKSKDLENNIFAIFFAYLLDGLVWDLLKEQNLIHDHVTTKDKPFWNGTFWLMEPKRLFSCGTNSIETDKYSINVNWSHNSKIKVSSYKKLKQLVNDYSENGKVTRIDIISEFKKYGICDKNGILLIPIIENNKTDDIYAQSVFIAEKVFNYLKNHINYSSILTETPGLTQGQKITILYHEIMWDILDTMEEKGLIQKPVAFKDPEKAKDMDLSHLIFIIKK